MSSGSKSRPPWQSVGSGAKDVKALNARPAWQSVGAGRSASSRSTSPVKPRDSTKRGSQSPTRLPADYNRSHTLHAYASDTVSSSTGTTNNSVLTGSSAQSLDEAPAAAARKEQPGSAGRERSTVAPKTPVQRTPAPRKPAARTTAPRTPVPRTPGPRSPQPTKPNVKATSHSSDSNRTPKRRGTSRQAPRQSSVRPKDKDGWEADSEDSFTVVGVEPKPCIWSGDQDSHESDIGVLVPVLRPPLTERGAAFAALSDASSAGSPSPAASPRAASASPCRSPRTNILDDDDAPGCEPAALPADLESLNSTVTTIQKDLASLRSSLSGPRLTSNPLSSPLSSPAASAALPPPAIMTNASTASSVTRRRQGLPARSRSDRARKVPLPPELTSAGLDTHAFSTIGSMSGTLSESPVRSAGPANAGGGVNAGGADLAPMATESSFGLSCGLPGLSHEVCETITHLTAAEVIQESVTVTALSLRDWLLRPTPTPFDPALTLYGAAVHNAHVAGCEVLIGGLLAAIEENTIERPRGLPSGSCQTAFGARGISNSDAARTVFRSIAEWIGEVSERADRSHAAVMQDPRALPLLSVLRFEALHRIGEPADDDVTTSESVRLQTRNRTEHLNATDMLYVLISALFPAFRHLASRHPEAASPAGSPLRGSPHGGVPTATAFDIASEDGDPAASASAVIQTALSSASLFSIPTEALPDVEESGALAAAADAARTESGVALQVDSGPGAISGEPVSAVESLGMVGSVTESMPSFAGGFGFGGLAGVAPARAAHADSVASCTTSDSGGAAAVGGGGRSRGGGGGGGGGSDGISQEALTGALLRLLSRDGGGEAAASDAPQSEADVIGALRQLASERVQQSRGDPAGSSVPPAAMFLEGHPMTEEARTAQAAEVDKLLQKPEVIKVLTQLASNAAVDLSGQHIQAAISRSEAARAYAARARNRSKALEVEMNRQRMIINTFANMNMVQQQMASHMFGTLIKGQGPAPGSTEVNAMIRSMAKRQGYQGLVKPLHTPGQSYMHGAVDSALPYGAAASGMPPSMMVPGGAAGGLSGQPGMSAFGAVQMPYLQMAGGSVPVPNSVLGGGTTFSMGGGAPGPGMQAPRSGGSLMRGGGGPSVFTGRGGGSGDSTNGSVGGRASRSRPRSHSSSTPKTPTLGGPMFAKASSGSVRGGRAQRQPSAQRVPQMQPFGGPSGYAASDGSRMLQPSSLGSDRAASVNNSTFMQSGSHMFSPSAFQAPPQQPQRQGSARTLPRPASSPMQPYSQQRRQSGTGYGSPDTSRRLSQPRSRQPAQDAAKPPKHSRSKSGADLTRRRDARPPSRERSPERASPAPGHAAEPKRGRSSRMMAAMQAAGRAFSGSRRRSSGRQPSRRTSKSPTKSPSPTRTPPPPRPTSGDSNRGQKVKPMPHAPPRPPVATVNPAMMRSTASSGPSATNSSFMFDSASSGYSTQFDSLSSLPTSGSSMAQAPATPPQAGGHRRSGSGGAAPPLIPQPAAAAPPPAAGPPASSGHRSGGGGGYPSLLPQQVGAPGSRRGAARRMTPQLAATPEVEEEMSSFMDL